MQVAMQVLADNNLPGAEKAWRDELTSRRLEQAARLIALVSGLALFAFAAAELCNYAIGLVSLEAMGDIAAWRTALIRSWPGAALLFVAFVSHIGTTLWFVARRATLRMSLWDAALTISGILVPLLLLPYIVDTRGASVLFGVDDDSLYQLAKLWPEHAFFYVILIVLLWGHGCLGLHQWLKLRPRYAAIAPVLAVLALALPIAAVAGLVAAARVVSVLMADEAFAAQVRAATRWPSAAAEDALWRWRLTAVAAYAAFLVAVAGAHHRAVPEDRGRAQDRRDLCQRPHAEGFDRSDPARDQPHPWGTARRWLRRTRPLHGVQRTDRARRGFVASPHGRRTRNARRGRSPHPAGVSDPALGGADGHPACAHRRCRRRRARARLAGIERQVAALCVQLQDQAALVGARRAYDAIFLLNEFLDMVHAAVANHKGWVVRMTGSGIVAVFGRDDTPQAACRAAAAASADIDVALDRMNEKFARRAWPADRCGDGTGVRRGLSRPDWCGTFEAADRDRPGDRCRKRPRSAD